MQAQEDSSASKAQPASLAAAPAQRQGRLRSLFGRLGAPRADLATGLAIQPEALACRPALRGQTLLSNDLPPFQETDPAAHRFDWLDDLACLSEPAAKDRAWKACREWFARFGTKQDGPVWAPEVTGRRLIRLIGHAPMLCAPMNDTERADFFALLGQHVRFLAHHAQRARPYPLRSGLPGFEARAGRVIGAASLAGLETAIAPAAAALGEACAAEIDAEGAIASRNAEELLEILILLSHAARVLRQADHPVPEALAAAISRIAPVLRRLRHADGSLPRFHGSHPGAPERTAAALLLPDFEIAPPRRKGPASLAMGYATLCAAQTSVIVDAAPPPAQSVRAEASTLAFELISDGAPLIVRFPPGARTDPETAQAERATAQHSTLEVDGRSSSRTAKAKGAPHRAEPFAEIVKDVWMRPGLDPARQADFGHEGYVAHYGLVHLRSLDLAADGARLSGNDRICGTASADRRHLEKLLDRAGLTGIPFRLHFHLHPDVSASVDPGGWSVTMRAPVTATGTATCTAPGPAESDATIWQFRFDGAVSLALRPSVWVEPETGTRREASQIVLSGRLLGNAEQISWTFEKARVRPASIPDGKADSGRPSPEPQTSEHKDCQP